MKPTICIHCKNYCYEKNLGVVYRGSDDPIWFEQRCGAVRDEIHPDYVNGIGLDAAGIGEMKYCREVNTNGECPHYVASEVAHA